MQFLRAGSQGPDVARVQAALNRRMLPPNNRFTAPPLAPLVEDALAKRLPDVIAMESRSWQAS